jgi:hypothetical protein
VIPENRLSFVLGFVAVTAESMPFGKIGAVPMGFGHGLGSRRLNLRACGGNQTPSAQVCTGGLHSSSVVLPLISMTFSLHSTWLAAAEFNLRLNEQSCQS